MKFKDAELLGLPTILVVGRGLAQGVVELRDRVSGVKEEIPLAEAVDRVVAACSRLTAARARAVPPIHLHTGHQATAGLTAR